MRVAPPVNGKLELVDPDAALAVTADGVLVVVLAVADTVTLRVTVRATFCGSVPVSTMSCAPVAVSAGTVKTALT